MRTRFGPLFRAISTTPGAVAMLAFGVLAITALSACSSDEPAPAPDAADDRFDAIGVDHAQPGVDATPDAADVHVTPPTDANSDVSIDAIDGDGGCACFPFDNDAGIAQAVITTSLECFSINARWMHEYSAYVADPCVGEPTYRREDVYGDGNLIGVWSTDAVRQEALYGYFYDLVTKALVGAVREAPWLGDDPSSCSPTGPHGGGRYNRLRAGVIPDCSATGWITCQVTSARTVTCPRDAGATDAGATDVGATDAGATDTSDDAVIDGADATDGAVIEGGKSDIDGA